MRVAAARLAAGARLVQIHRALLATPERVLPLLSVVGALAPAVLNYMFAERYNQEPEKVASMVLIGNLAAVVFLPLALALVLD